MSVLKGEGTTVMLYGATNVSTGARSYPGYLARPDLRGEWPTIVVASPANEPASSVNAICRGIARHGLAAAAPAPGGLDAFIGFITASTGHWSNAEHGFGMLGLGDGSTAAIAEAAASDLVAAIAIIDPVLDEAALRMFGEVTVPLLGCVGRDVSEGLDEARAAAPQAEWVVYDGAGSAYWDIDADGYSPAAAEDTQDRVVEFFTKNLPERI